MKASGTNAQLSKLLLTPAISLTHTNIPHTLHSLFCASFPSLTLATGGRAWPASSLLRGITPRSFSCTRSRSCLRWSNFLRRHLHRRQRRWISRVSLSTCAHSMPEHSQSPHSRPSAIQILPSGAQGLCVLKVVGVLHFLPDSQIQVIVALASCSPELFSATVPRLLDALRSEFSGGYVE
jgi:hypothetical protein